MNNAPPRRKVVLFQLLSLDGVTAALSRALGRPVRYRPISMEELDGPASRTTSQASCATSSRRSSSPSNTDVTDDVERALGRPPRDIDAFARAAAAVGAWTRPKAA